MLQYNIQNSILDALVNSGARLAEPGEFTLRAFMAGKLDLSQAEAVAAMIASGNKAEHSVALNQLRGGYSDDFHVLRENLLNLLSLIELELDFGEEDVNFADREQLRKIMTEANEKDHRTNREFQIGQRHKEVSPVR